VDMEGLWYRVLKARQGEEGGQLKEGGRESSLWWRMLCGVCEGAGLGVGRWFDSNSRRVVGNGRNASFWFDRWVGDVPLRDKFPRLFDLAVDKEALVVDMATRGWGEGGNAWRWRRQLLAWEEESVRECVATKCV